MRVLFLADTHLGFDYPLRPKVEKRRRGPEFFDSFRRAVDPALNNEVDLVIHGGDIFYRSKVRLDVVDRTLGIIAEVTDKGIPFILVPGNHERSMTPLPLFWNLEGLHVFRKPDTFIIDAAGERLALAGFPCERNGILQTFPKLFSETGWDKTQADIRLLCLHQSVEGATVGPADYTFRHGEDIIPGRMIPKGFAAVLSGHIHRRQILTMDLRGNPLPSSVIYPGSTERTAFAEKDETKGYVILELEGTSDGQGRLVEQEFIPLQSRPMVDLNLRADDQIFEQRLHETLAEIDPESIVRMTLMGQPTVPARKLLAAANLRKLAPMMNIELRWLK